MSDEKKKTETADETAAEEKKEPTPAKEESKKEAPAESSEVTVPEKFRKMVEQVEKMTVLELNELVKVLEKKFGVSAQTVAVAAPGPGGVAGEEEKTEFNVELTSAGDQKIAIIKIVKEALTLGLKEAKDLVESAPAMLKEGMRKADAEELQKKVKDAGGKITLK